MQESELVRVRLEVGGRFEIVEDHAHIFRVVTPLLPVDVAVAVPRMEAFTMLTILLLADMSLSTILLINLQKLCSVQ